MSLPTFPFEELFWCELPVDIFDKLSRAKKNDRYERKKFISEHDAAIFGGWHAVCSMPRQERRQLEEQTAV
jgi:hypothetical protein